MTAPSPTARGTPVGKMLKNGWRTLITFANAPTLGIWEKTVQPPGLDTGDSIDITTMHNDKYRTFAPRTLVTATEMSSTFAYDPAVLTTLVAQLGVETTITVWHSDGSSWSFYGYLKTFEPQENEEGTQPEAQVTIAPTNADPVTGAEEAMVYDEAETTTTT